MSQHPSTIAREAKQIHQGIKELLKSKEPFDKEVDIQRKNLRKHYLLLLLNHPNAKESKDVENHMWMQTSYALIAVYKQRIAALDRFTQNHQSKQQGNNHAVEYRKLLQRFRSFLTEEERFWMQLIVRYHRSFALEDAQLVLVSLGILSTTNDGQVMEGPNVTAPATKSHQFPVEDPESSVIPSSEAERESRMAILSKALICLGDIARYKEQYNDSQGRSRVGREDIPGPTKRGKHRKGGSSGLEGLPRPRNFSRAKQCYEKARLLVPHEGNASHQLAILAAYQKDSFGSLVHYYRALCVRQPYDTASENMGTVLSKAYDLWNSKDHETNIALDESAVPKFRIDAMTDKIVVLHALWRFRLDRMQNLMRKIADEVFREFSVLIEERHLPADMIVHVVVASQGALWKHKMIREPPPSMKKWKSESAPPTLTPPSTIEIHMFAHVLSVHRALLEVGLEQLKDFSAIDTAESDLAVLAQQRVNPVFRKILPALRIASKWVRANLAYITGGVKGTKRNGDTQNQPVNEQTKSTLTDQSVGLLDFWTAYADFLRALSRAFSVDRLPAMRAPLEEDIDTRGFLPLVSVMGWDDKAMAEDQEHPNVLNLMRIRDLLNDAKLIVETDNSPLALYGQHFMLKGIESEPAGLNVLKTGPTLLDEREEDRLTEATSQTDEDPVRAAFQFLDNTDSGAPEDDDDEEDEVVYLRGQAPLAAQSGSCQSPVLPMKSAGSSLSPTTLTPTHTIAKSPLSSPLRPPTSVAPTTAQDLLNNMMGSPKTNATKTPIAPPSTFLFGSDRPGQSIWSASRDEQSLKFSPSSHTVQPRYLPPAQPSQWPYTPTQANRLSLSSDVMSSDSLGRMERGHQRTSSLMTTAQYHPNTFSHPTMDGFGGFPAGAQHSVGIQAPSFPSYTPSAAEMDPNGVFYSTQGPVPPSGMHSRQLSFHDSSSMGQTFAHQPAVSQPWGTMG